MHARARRFIKQRAGIGHAHQHQIAAQIGMHAQIMVLRLDREQRQKLSVNIAAQAA